MNEALKGRIFLLMYENSDGVKDVNSAYASEELAQAWQGRLIEELLNDTRLADEETLNKEIAQVQELLAAGNVGAAAQIFNDMQGDQVWIEPVLLETEPPKVGQAIGYFV